MKVEQYVMAYEVEHDRLRAVIPDGFSSIRPVLRINAEIRDDSTACVEFNTAVERNHNKGWLNIDYWNDVPFERNGNTVVFNTDFLEISFTESGIEGSCPAERDNTGCFFIGDTIKLRAPEVITANKEYCDCSFRWKLSDIDAHGSSTGKTLPAYPTEVINIYPRENYKTENIVKIPCIQVLGAYLVRFDR